MIESKLISKILDAETAATFYELHRYNVDVTDFPTLGEVYTFIKGYVRENNSIPDYRTVVADFEDFEYVPEVADSVKFLAKKLKAQSAKRQAFDLLQHQASKNFSQMSGDAFVKWLAEETEKIRSTTTTDNEFGTNFATNGDERREWYEYGKEKRSMMFIPTPYESLTNALGGGFELSDYILLMAFTNRGKSWLASDMGLCGWKAGFGVLHYSPELSKKQQVFRLDTLNGHFDNVKLRRGQLDEEGRYMEYLDGFTTDSAAAPYIIKTMEDLPNGLTLETIEADLQTNPNINMVIIDGFNLMIHKNGKGMRDAMTFTSRRLRQIFGRYDVAGIVVHQTPGSAEKDNREEDDSGTRVVKPPRLTDYSETVAVIQDAATALTFDQHEGIGKISIEKAREPSVGKVIELSVDFNMGYIKEQTPMDFF